MPGSWRRGPLTARGRWLLFLGVALTGALWLADAQWVPRGGPHAEELPNLYQALTLPGPSHPNSLSSPYQAFCGGCTVHAVLVSPLLAWKGMDYGTYRWVILGAHLLTLAAGATLLRRLLGTPSAMAFLLLMGPGATGLQRDLVQHGWANHAESTALPMLAAALACGRRWRRREATLSGFLAGLGTWYCLTGAVLVPGLLILVAHRRPRHATWVAAGFCLGLMPFVPTLMGIGEGGWASYSAGILHAPEVGTMQEVATRLFGPWLGDRLWPLESQHLALGGDPARPRLLWRSGTAWLLACWAAALLGLAFARRDPQGGRRTSYAAVSLFTYILAFSLMAGQWRAVPPDLNLAFFSGRYQAPLLLLLSFAAAHLLAPGPLLRRSLGALVVLCLAMPGAAERWPSWRLDAFDHAGHRPFELGQPVDRWLERETAEAALATLRLHEDSLEALRHNHQLRLGMRMAAELRDGQSPAPLLAALKPLSLDLEDRTWVYRGLAPALLEDSATLGPAGRATLAALTVQDPLGVVEAWRALGHQGAVVPPGASARPEDQRALAEGQCAREGEAWLARATEDGRLWPDAERISHAGPPPCSEHTAFWEAVAWRWAWIGGCADGSPLPAPSQHAESFRLRLHRACAEQARWFTRGRARSSLSPGSPN